MGLSPAYYHIAKLSILKSIEAKNFFCIMHMEF
jgi:hypothetical protein